MFLGRVADADGSSQRGLPIRWANNKHPVVVHAMDRRQVNRHHRQAGGEVFVEFQRRHCADARLLAMRDETDVTRLHGCRKLRLPDGVENVHAVERAQPVDRWRVADVADHDQRPDGLDGSLDEPPLQPVVEGPGVDRTGRW